MFVKEAVEAGALGVGDRIRGPQQPAQLLVGAELSDHIAGAGPPAAGHHPVEVGVEVLEQQRPDHRLGREVLPHRIERRLQHEAVHQALDAARITGRALREQGGEPLVQKPVDPDGAGTPVDVLPDVLLVGDRNAVAGLENLLHERRGRGRRVTQAARWAPAPNGRSR
ncbi:hypothetical protein NCG97_13975 [Streptomyces lydicamycinicus]|uniref:hypothetical protein n=1 Tax=Streptomyces lydicamycinicus TaxID=1546107 RepID=UPI002034C555|nr:hypothetical protein [Streptomyces lydicamycinicus]USA01539.1 hypothetical protein NCG97_13975 [Streptomyces lydicamycinicus]